VTSGGEVNIQL